MPIKSSNVISGPQIKFRVPEGSIGKYLFDCLRKQNPQHVIMINAQNGKALKTEDILQNSLKATKVLQTLGLQKSDTIALVAENTINYCIIQLAAFYMGVTLQLLNPLYSIGELKHAFSLSKPKLILCTQLSLKNVIKTNQELKLENTRVLLLEGTSENNHDTTSLEDLLENTSFVEPNSFHPEILNPDQVALILMSSGTTGLPKGTILTHANIRAVFDYLLHDEYIGGTSTDVTVLVLPFFHVFGTLIGFISLAIGMKAVLLSKFTPDSFLGSIQKYKPTMMFIVPPILLFLAKSPLVETYNISSIKDIVVGGAPVGKQLQEDAAKKLTNAFIRQVYGLTEICGACTLTRKNTTGSGSVGILVPHIHAKVWDCDLQQNLGPLKIGELCFKGPMVMKGYIGNADITKLCIDEGGFYHTGDLGYFDENEEIYIVDRMKDLIKYKGFQVPPAELETLILTHPAVKDCGVIGIPDERAGQVPLAFVVKRNGVEVTQKDIIDYVAERISVQKHLYGGVKFIDEIPKNPSGKILRRELIEIFNAKL